MVSWWVALEGILLVPVIGLMHMLCGGGTNLIQVDLQVHKLGLLQVRVLVSLPSSSREAKPELLFGRGLGWAGMVANYLVRPGPEEDILLLDFDFLTSSFGESFFSLYIKRCLTQQRGWGEGGDADSFITTSDDSGGDVCSARTQS